MSLPVGTSFPWTALQVAGRKNKRSGAPHLPSARSIIRAMTSLIAASPYTRVRSPVLTHSTTALIAPASSFETRTMKVANAQGPSPPWLVTANLLGREVRVRRPARDQRSGIPGTGRTFSGGALVIRQCEDQKGRPRTTLTRVPHRDRG